MLFVNQDFDLFCIVYKEDYEVKDEFSIFFGLEFSILILCELANFTGINSKKPWKIALASVNYHKCMGNSLTLFCLKLMV